MTPLRPAEVAAVVPCHREPPVDGLLESIAGLIPRVVVVDDGLRPDAAQRLERLSAGVGAEVVRNGGNRGKGHAIAAGLAFLRCAEGAPAGVLSVDADGQHPPDAIPAFLAAAAEAELVIGNRFSGAGRMPVIRGACNRLASGIVTRTSGHETPDSQCGMRLLLGRALTKIEFPPGAMESETRHLKRCLRAGVRVAWVPIPAIYDGRPSSFRAVRDGVSVLRAAARR